MNLSFAFVVGILLALAICFGGALIRFDRDRVFYPFMTMVVASYYALFAIMGGSPHALLLELGPITVFLIASILGFKLNLWIVAVAMFGHGIFDFFHGGLISNPGVPVWWPAFCGSYDVTAAAILVLRRSKIAPPSP